MSHAAKRMSEPFEGLMKKLAEKPPWAFTRYLHSFLRIAQKGITWAEGFTLTDKNK